MLVNTSSLFEKKDMKGKPQEVKVTRLVVHNNYGLVLLDTASTNKAEVENFVDKLTQGMRMAARTTLAEFTNQQGTTSYFKVCDVASIKVSHFQEYPTGEPLGSFTAKLLHTEQAYH